MVYNLFDQKTDSGIKKKNISNKKLAEELQNPNIKKIIKKEKYNHTLWILWVNMTWAILLEGKNDITIIKDPLEP